MKHHFAQQYPIQSIVYGIYLGTFSVKWTKCWYTYSHTAIRDPVGYGNLDLFVVAKSTTLQRLEAHGYLLRHLSGLGCVVLFPFLTWPRNQMDPNGRRNHGQLISKWLTTKRLVGHQNVGLDWTPSLHGLSMAKINGGGVAPNY